ncbi:sodium-dependent glucose transporter 1-like protein [Leptotrombidium deliense]|uniref:Sodium-dependent glucose transporter 1-like protein n=1 Tax=Leptotrombidium deliense TaxID=299467 RepID=A0A443SJ15_9ACAR|nr:sodium-dependent glucose transporter 1-like protein [Leptotrombidium deliense]
MDRDYTTRVNQLLFEITKTTIEMITFGLTMRSAGSCIGALTSSLVYAKFNEMVVYSTLIVLMGSMSLAIANLTNLIHHLMLQFALGIVSGLTDVGSSILIFQIWKNKGGPFLQTSSFAFTISGIISPLIFETFLSVQMKSKRETHSFSLNTNQNYSLSSNATQYQSRLMLQNDHQLHNNSIEQSMNNIFQTVPTHLSESHIWIPYTLVGVFIIIAGLMALSTPLLLCFSKRKAVKRMSVNSELEANETLISEKLMQNDTKDHKDEEMIIEKSNDEQFQFAMVCCIFFFVYYGLNDTTWQFWLTFVMNSRLQVSKSEGVFMISEMNVTVTIINFLGIIFAATVHPSKILAILTSLVAIGNVIHLFFANSSLVLLKIGALIEGAGFGCMYAAVFNYTQREVGLTNSICSALVLASYSASAVGYSAIIGRFIEKNPMILIQTNLLIIVFMIICLCSLKAIEKRAQTRKLLDISNEFM